MGLHWWLQVYISVAAAVLAATPTKAQRPPFSCDSSNPSTSKFTFCKTQLPVKQRAEDLVSRLTLDEKVSQLVNDAPAIPRLGIPAYQWWSESLHGVANAGRGISFQGVVRAATSFPQVILTAASFDSHLWFRIGQVIGKEARAVYNSGQATGMTFWAPNINIFRDPRWGRGQETPGEDPLVTGRYAVSYVRGVQGDSFDGGSQLTRDGYLQASACCKHFTAYDLDRWNNVTRYAFNAHVTAQDLADTYQPPFQRCIQEGRASGIMCAYNQVNGVPNCADYNLLTTIARGKWGFNGYITSDCDAVSIIYTNQGYAKVPEDAVADVLKAGMDVNCGDYLKTYTKTAVEQKKLQEAEIDRALANLFAIRMRLGLFNGNPTKLLFGDIGAAQVCSQEHKALALEAARDGIVLLKNDGKLLPLPRWQQDRFSLAVIGPNADSLKTLLGNYYGPPCISISPLQALQHYVNSRIRYLPGCDNVACNTAWIHDAVNVAREVDYVVLIMGLDQTQEREDYDRDDLVLPGKQQAVITEVARAAKKPVVLVLLCGGPVDVSFAKYDNKIGSIIWAGYPGEAGGTALAQIIFGDHNPGGRLPITWYPNQFIRVPMTDMRMRANPASDYPGRTYRFYQGEKVFEFGHGLSYSTYSYQFMSVSQNKLHLPSAAAIDVKSAHMSTRYASVSDIGSQVCESMKFNATIGVENHGEMEGKHPVLLYMRREKASKDDSPIKQLVGFQPMSLKAGERGQVEFVLSPCEYLSRADEDGVLVLEEGTHFLTVGDQEFPFTITV
ncbi:Probable beta-D-xylosidase 7 [Dionaea muscipula]